MKSWTMTINGPLMRRRDIWMAQFDVSTLIYSDKRCRDSTWRGFRDAHPQTSFERLGGDAMLTKFTVRLCKLHEGRVLINCCCIMVRLIVSILWSKM